MTERRQRAKPTERGAAVWIDHDQSVILTQGTDEQVVIERLERSPAESEPAFELRTTARSSTGTASPFRVLPSRGSVSSEPTFR